MADSLMQRSCGGSGSRQRLGSTQCLSAIFTDLFHEEDICHSLGGDLPVLYAKNTGT